MRRTSPPCDTFSLREKSDAIAGYLYLKYTDLFISTIVRIIGVPAKEPAVKVDDGIAVMMELMAQGERDKCDNCQNFRPEAGDEFFNCTDAKHSGIKYGMQVRADSRVCEASISK